MELIISYIFIFLFFAFLGVLSGYILNRRGRRDYNWLTTLLIPSFINFTLKLMRYPSLQPDNFKYVNICAK